MRARGSGFTLVELSVVLVVIGLIIGGVLVGQDLIAVAGTRAQIAQIEKFNLAVTTFKGKYGYLPGDLPDPDATQYGFIARNVYTGTGDGNGIIEGVDAVASDQEYGGYQCAGETVVFWSDLARANLIDNGGFTLATNAVLPDLPVSGVALGEYFPAAKIGRGNFIYAWGIGTTAGTGNGENVEYGFNYFGLAAITSVDVTCQLNSQVGLTVKEAYYIDTKIDDGLPQSGKVLAEYLDYSLMPTFDAHAAGGGVEGAMWYGQGALPSATTCYDNNGAAGEQHHYSMSQNNGNGINCALTFQME